MDTLIQGNFFKLSNFLKDFTLALQIIFLIPLKKLQISYDVLYVLFVETDRL